MECEAARKRFSPAEPFGSRIRRFGRGRFGSRNCRQGCNAKRNGGWHRDGTNPGSERVVGTARPVVAGIAVMGGRATFAKLAINVRPLT